MKEFDWDHFFQKSKSHHLSKSIAEYKKSETRKLIIKWLKNELHKKTLKTDCYEEVFSYDSVVDLFSNITIIDISRRAIEIAKRNFPNKKFLVGDICKLPFKNNSFDVIVSLSTIDNISYKKVNAALKEIKRVLKPKGKLLITIDNKENLLYSFFYFLNKYLKFTKYYQDRCYSRQEIIKLLDKHNFKIEKIESLIHVIPGTNFLVKFIEKINYRYMPEFIFKIARFLSKSKIRFQAGWFISILAKNS